MSNYVKTTDFASKDTLASGNPLKTIKGTEFDVEFNNLVTASATKANLAAPTFTGIPLADTAALATNTQQLATTAFVTAAVAAVDNTVFVLKANNLSDLVNNSTARTNLGLAIGTDVQAYDATILVDADIGVNVQAYDATIVVDADIGTTVQAYDATILVDADIGVNVQAYDATILVDADIGSTVQAYNAAIMVDGDIGVTVQGYDADTSKTDVAETRSASINMADNIVQRPVIKDYAETKVAMAANDVDLSLGNVQTKTISGAQTLTFSNSPASGSAGSFTLLLTNGGSATVTWPTSVDWPVGTAPTLTAAGLDILVFTTIDGGTTWYGIASGIGMA